MSTSNEEKQILSSELEKPKYDSNLKIEENINETEEINTNKEKETNFPIEELEKKLEKEEKNTQEENVEMKNNIELNNNKVSWIEQVIKKNFMPAILLLEKGVIEVNSIIPNLNDSLLHLSVSFGYYNVTRCLIEKFKGDPNIKNKMGSTPLHLVCSNPTKDIAILIYLLTRENIKINEQDNFGMTPIFYSVINNFEDAFLLLISKGVDLTQTDIHGNNLMYYSIVSGNLFIFKFLEKHCNQISLISYNMNSKGETFSDISIQYGNHKIIQKILQIYYQKISIESLVNCCNSIKLYKLYSKDIYENLNICYFYKLRKYKNLLYGFLPFLNVFFGKIGEKISIDSNSFSKLSEENAPNNNKIFFVNVLDNIYLYLFFIISDYNLLYYTSSFYLMICFYSEYLFIQNNENGFNQFLNILVSFLLMFFIIIIQYFKNDKEVFIEERYNLNDVENNFLHQYILVNDPLKVHLLPSSKNNICEICLRIKDKYTFHCMKCDKCVKNYYFHSYIYNFCIHRKNIWYYNMTLLFLSLHLFMIGNNTENIFIKLILYFFIIFIFGKIFSIIICIGSNTPYKIAYSEEEEYLEDHIEVRNRNYAPALKMNTISFVDFIKNLFIY